MTNSILNTADSTAMDGDEDPIAALSQSLLLKKKNRLMKPLPHVLAKKATNFIEEEKKILSAIKLSKLKQVSTESLLDDWQKNSKFH